MRPASPAGTKNIQRALRAMPKRCARASRRPYRTFRWRFEMKTLTCFIGSCLVVAVAVGQTTFAVPQPNYQTYTNARFKYSISYPSNLLIPQGEAENGDGQ